MTMTVHTYRPRQFHRTSNGENPSSGYRDMGSASLAAARPAARTVTTIPLQPGGLRGKKHMDNKAKINRGIETHNISVYQIWRIYWCAILIAHQLSWQNTEAPSLFLIPTGSAHRSVHGLFGFTNRRSDWLMCVRLWRANPHCYVSK